MNKGPVLIDLEDEAQAPNPTEVPPVPDVTTDIAPEGRAMRTMATLASRRPSRLARLFWGLLLTLLGAVVSIAAWNFVTGLIAQNPVLGYAVTGLVAAFALVCFVLVLRELAAFSRLSRMDRLHRRAETALTTSDLSEARGVLRDLNRLYAGREDVRWGQDRVRALEQDQLDASGLLGLAETEILKPLDLAASREIEAAARQVATVTAIVPLAFADVIAALTANLRMIRRIAEVYGGRSGTLGSWRLARAVMTHLVATGAVAIGDDMIGSIAGGGVLSKLSRRFGEGIVNGALTARVGVAAMEVCRPIPFATVKRPSVTRLVQRALTGLFSKT
ncbi:YcjF family protein [Roseovarius rhodophyticola]|uniref:TIGR01620 family protein n=1 Tax=Roseovarius rhodophyticola TaxID=3080827 RepID=A0ABZ2TBQ7_9RHOB|nr:TIGR01620 family protein [Roseovarius sp. W115]MDV2930872.1 TIGR01620 family protein [Roseovarius sp. W115]